MSPAGPLASDEVGLFAGLRVVERGLLPAPVARVLGWGRARAMRVLPVDLGGVGSTFGELFDGTAVQALARFGIRAVGEPSEADVVVVTGAIGPRGVDVLARCLAAVALPRYVVAVGDEVQGRAEGGASLVALHDLVPVDVRVDGSDPSPGEVLAALVGLAEEVRVEDPAARWAVGADLAAFEEALGVRASGLVGSVPPLLAALVVDDATGAVTDVVQQTGATHRGLERALAATAEPWRSPIARHLDAASAVALPLGLAEAVEAALDTAPPEAERWRRAVLLEASRVAVALDDLGPASALLGAPRRAAPASVAAVALHRAARAGATEVAGVAGVAAALPAAEVWLGGLVHGVLGSARVQRRTRDLAVVARDAAVAHGLSGVNLRASGASLDARSPGGEPREPWSATGWQPRTHPSGDVHARLWLRAIEALDSIALLRELLARPGRAEGPWPGPDLGRRGSPAVGEALVEHPRGLLLCRVHTTGDPSSPLWRVRVAGPSSAARAILPSVLRGVALEDVPLVVASFGVSSVEADR